MVPELVEGHKAKPSPRAAHFAQRRGGEDSVHLLPFDKLRDHQFSTYLNLPKA